MEKSNTIRSFRYIASLLLLLAVSLSVSANSSHKKHYSKAVAKVVPTGVGKVYVSQKNTIQTTDTDVNEQNCGSSKDKDTHTYYFFADDVAEYLWDGWSDGDMTQKSYLKTVTATSEDAKSPTLLELTAQWVQPSVASGGNTVVPAISAPTQTATGTVVFTLSDDRDAANFYINDKELATAHITALDPLYERGKYSLPFTYMPQGVHGVYTAYATLTSNYGGSSKTASIQLTEDYTPTFTRPADIAFGEVSLAGATSGTAQPTGLNYAASHAEWTAYITGADAAYFAIEGTQADGKAYPTDGLCEVTFAPRSGERNYAATLTLQCVYTDAAGNRIESTAQTTTLTGKGSKPTVPILAINPDASNPGNTTVSTSQIGYTYPAIYGTSSHSAFFSVGYALLDEIQCVWEGNEQGVFSIVEGEATSGDVEMLPITIHAHVAEAAADTTDYTATLVVTGKRSTDEGETTLTQRIQVSATFYPKKANTLAWALTPSGQNYMLYTDDVEMPIYKDKNNLNPLTISSTSKDFATYFTVETEAGTIRPVKGKGVVSWKNLKVVQEASDEVEGITLSTNIQVLKHKLVLTYPHNVDLRNGDGQKLYKNTRYPHVVSTNSIDAGEAEGFTEFTYFDATPPQLGQSIIDNGDGTFGIHTGDLTGQFRIKYSVPETENYYGATGGNSWLYIIKDPIHVSTGVGTLTKATTGVLEGQWYGLWNNNADWMYGSTFKVSENRATFIGYDWASITQEDGSKKNGWTGINTGRTDWTTGTDQGATNAFALENGGFVVYQFRGVPFYTSFNMYFQSTTADGTVRVEQSADGMNWESTVPGSTSATYLSTAGGKGVYMSPTSRYIRFSYSGANHVVIYSNSTSENNHVRTDFTLNKTDAKLMDTQYHELSKHEDGTWGTFDFTLKIANWGENGISHTIDNPDFELEYAPIEGKGLDQYREIPVKVRYKGTKFFDQGVVTIHSRDFYGRANVNDTLRSLTFTVTAVGKGTAMPTTIAYADRFNTYMTGTVGPMRSKRSNLLKETDYKYSQTRGTNPHTGLNEHDFSACFGTDGSALFDYLYIFGVTTNNDGSAETYTYWYEDENGEVVSAKNTFQKITNASGNAASNAVTPCYVYKKSGNAYTLAQTIPNMNVGNKPIGTITASGKYYFSGHCPSASAGYQGDDMGVLHFKGGSSTDIHIYLDNCSLIARSKSEYGVSTPAVLNYTSMGQLNQLIKGSGAVIVLETTDTKNAFKPQIHLKGENYLKSNTGMQIHVSILGKTADANQSSAPIHIYTSDMKGLTELSIDDIWPTAGSTTTHVNGGLQLRKATFQTPSIDLGNDKSKLYFNGGRISLENAFPMSNNYLTTFAISARKYSVSIVSMYGLGGDYDGGEIHFNDGTISVLPMSRANLNIAEGTYNSFVGHYRDSISIKCPSKTYVNGGNYISSIWACTEPTNLGTSPLNRYNDAVVAHVLKVDAVDETTGLASITFPKELKNTDETDTYFGETLEQYYTRHGQDYGRESLTANDSNYVQLMLPAKYTGRDAVEETFVTPWALMVTPITIGASGQTQAIGENKNVAYSKNEQTQNFLWTKIDAHIRAVAKDKNYKTPILSNSGVQVDATIESIGDADYASVANTEDYEIEQKLYLMQTVTADTWYSMVAPFDISNIYVFDSYPDQELKKMERADAIKQQATANMDLAYSIAYPITNQSTQDLSSFINTFVNYGYKQDVESRIYLNPNPGQDYPAYPNADYRNNWRGQHPIIAFNGKNAKEAHYYLHHSATKTWAFDGSKFQTDWEYVTPVEKVIGEETRSVLMQQGEIYALQFPYCPNCDDPMTRDYYDYWTGKFILFEGYGPQTVRGKNAQAEQLAPYEVANSGVLRGNMTLASMEVPNSTTLTNAYFQGSGEKRNLFVHDNTNSETGKLEPTGVFILANPAGTRNFAGIHVRSGEVTYGDDETGFGTPTIAGGRTLLVSATEQVLRVEALEPQQVSIYTAAGQLIQSQWLDGVIQLSLPQGLYIVRGETDEAKAILR